MRTVCLCQIYIVYFYSISRRSLQERSDRLKKPYDSKFKGLLGAPFARKFRRETRSLRPIPSIISQMRRIVENDRRIINAIGTCKW